MKKITISLINDKVRPLKYCRESKQQNTDTSKSKKIKRVTLSGAKKVHIGDKQIEQKIETKSIRKKCNNTVKKAAKIVSNS